MLQCVSCGHVCGYVKDKTHLYAVGGDLFVQTIFTHVRFANNILSRLSKRQRNHSRRAFFALSNVLHQMRNVVAILSQASRT